MSSELSQKSLHITISKSIGDVSGLFYLPDDVKYVLVFAHGAGAGIKNKFMESVSLSLAEQGIATLRFNFPYMETGKKMPDTKPVCIASIKAAVEKQVSLLSISCRYLRAGKSFGGRMTSTASSEGALPEIKGIIFFGFPLHPPGKPSSDRAEHLYKVDVPMLFMQGTRNALASPDLLKPVLKKLGKKAELFSIEGADHSFHLPAKASAKAGCPKEYNLKDSDVIELLSKEVRRWMDVM